MNINSLYSKREFLKIDIFKDCLNEKFLSSKYIALYNINKKIFLLECNDYLIKKETNFLLKKKKKVSCNII